MKTPEEIIEALIFQDDVVLDSLGEDIRFVSANDAINAMKEYASQSQGNKDLIIEKQGELNKRQKHLSNHWRIALKGFGYLFGPTSEHIENSINQLESELSALQSVTPDKAEGEKYDVELLKTCMKEKLKAEGGAPFDESGCFNPQK